MHTHTRIYSTQPEREKQVLNMAMFVNEEQVCFPIVALPPCRSRVTKSANSTQRIQSSQLFMVVKQKRFKGKETIRAKGLHYWFFLSLFVLFLFKFPRLKPRLYLSFHSVVDPASLQRSCHSRRRCGSQEFRNTCQKQNEVSHIFFSSS